MRILALDVGLSAIKAAVLDVENANAVGPVARVEYERDRPTPEADEVPARRLWDAFTRAARQATRGIEGIDGVGLCCFSPALVLLDEKDEPLIPIRTPLDRRARTAARQVWASVGQEFLNTVGIRPLPGGCPAVVLRQIINDVYHVDRHIRSLLSLNGWLGFRLTGAKAFDLASAGVSGLFDTLTTRCWSPRWGDFFSVDPAWLPPVVCGSTTIGTLKPTVAVELGLPPGLPVKIGADDIASTALAAELKPGDLLQLDGATQVLTTPVEKPVPHEGRMARLLGVGDTFLHLTHNPVGASSLNWLHDLCFRDQPGEEFFSKTVGQALDRKTRVTLDPPYLAGDRLEIEAHRAAFRDVTLATDRLDLLAALLHEMRRQHQRAFTALGMTGKVGRTILVGEGLETTRRLSLEDEQGPVQEMDQGALHGIAALFRPRLC